ncbi:hypothetical protein BDV3_000821 [Batrachochytrium dendrobatidis]
MQLLVFSFAALLATSHVVATQSQQSQDCSDSTSTSAACESSRSLSNLRLEIEAQGKIRSLIEDHDEELGQIRYYFMEKQHTLNEADERYRHTMVDAKNSNLPPYMKLRANQRFEAATVACRKAKHDYENARKSLMHAQDYKSLLKRLQTRPGANYKQFTTYLHNIWSDMRNAKHEYMQAKEDMERDRRDAVHYHGSKIHLYKAYRSSLGIFQEKKQRFANLKAKFEDFAIRNRGQYEHFVFSRLQKKSEDNPEFPDSSSKCVGVWISGFRPRLTEQSFTSTKDDSQDADPISEPVEQSSIPAEDDSQDADSESESVDQSHKKPVIYKTTTTTTTAGDHIKGVDPMSEPVEQSSIPAEDDSQDADSESESVDQSHKKPVIYKTTTTTTTAGDHTKDADPMSEPVEQSPIPVDDIQDTEPVSEDDLEDANSEPIEQSPIPAEDDIQDADSDSVSEDDLEDANSKPIEQSPAPADDIQDADPKPSPAEQSPIPADDIQDADPKPEPVKQGRRRPVIVMISTTTTTNTGSYIKDADAKRKFVEQSSTATKGDLQGADFKPEPAS